MSKLHTTIKTVLGLGYRVKAWVAGAHYDPERAGNIVDRKSTRVDASHYFGSRMPYSRC